MNMCYLTGYMSASLFSLNVIGKKLMDQICTFTRKNNAKKLHISVHSSEESQRFYRRYGCRDATEINKE
jgi:ribosomal protein S18 acetylase RimI-like enzyme